MPRPAPRKSPLATAPFDSSAFTPTLLAGAVVAALVIGVVCSALPPQDVVSTSHSTSTSIESRTE